MMLFRNSARSLDSGFATPSRLQEVIMINARVSILGGAWGAEAPLSKILAR